MTYTVERLSKNYQYSQQFDPLNVERRVVEHNSVACGAYRAQANIVTNTVLIATLLILLVSVIGWGKISRYVTVGPHKIAAAVHTDVHALSPTSSQRLSRSSFTNQSINSQSISGPPSTNPKRS